MIYSFSKRKELNRMLRQQHPEIVFQEDTSSVPRMRTFSLPKGVQPVKNEEELVAQTIQYWQQYRQPMPVFLTYHTERWEKARPVEINYVYHRSQTSMEQAVKYIAGLRLYTYPLSLEPSSPL